MPPPSSPPPPAGKQYPAWLSLFANPSTHTGRKQEETPIDPQIEMISSKYVVMRNLSRPCGIVGISCIAAKRDPAHVLRSRPFMSVKREVGRFAWSDQGENRDQRPPLNHSHHESFIQSWEVRGAWHTDCKFERTPYRYRIRYYY